MVPVNVTLVGRLESREGHWQHRPSDTQGTGH